MPKTIPTDLALLEEIYKTHYRGYADYSDDRRTRSSKIWMPIDINALAAKFGVDADLIFGRLYYHLNEKFSHTNGDGSRSEFFAIRIGGDHHCVNFPYLAAILATLQDEQWKFVIATAIAGVSLIVSLLSMVVAVIA